MSFFSLLKEIKSEVDNTPQGKSKDLTYTFSYFQVLRCSVGPYYANILQFKIKRFLMWLTFILGGFSVFVVFFGWLVYSELGHFSMLLAFRMNFDIVFAIDSPYHFDLQNIMLIFGVVETYSSVYVLASFFGIFLALRNDGWRQGVLDQKDKAREKVRSIFDEEVEIINKKLANLSKEFNQKVKAIISQNSKYRKGFQTSSISLDNLSISFAINRQLLKNVKLNTFKRVKVESNIELTKLKNESIKEKAKTYTEE